MVASLIADHLKIQKLDYCLSVFLPESGYSVLNHQELKLLMKVESEESVLEALVSDQLMLKPKEVQRYNAATQTFTGDAIMNLEERLNYVDTSFRQKMEGELLRPQQDMEQRMLKWKKEYDLRWKAEMSAEISRVKEFECAQIRIDEAEKQRRKMEEYREQLEKNYQDKLSKLRDREKDALDRAAQKMKEIEGLNYHYRQKIMKDHELLKLKEQDLKKQQELNDQQLRTTQHRLEDKERELKRRLFEVQTDQDDKARKHKDELNQSKAAAMGQFSSERDDMLQKQRKLDAELKKLENLKQQIETLQNDNKDLIAENEKYVHEIRQLKKQKKEAETDSVTPLPPPFLGLHQGPAQHHDRSPAQRPGTPPQVRERPQAQGR